jgi:hypothetical protein
MPNTPGKKKKKMSAEKLAQLAESGEDITNRFKTGKMKPALDEVSIIPGIQRVNVDFAKPMLGELDSISQEMNISRQSLIKTWLRDALDGYYERKKHRGA